MALVRRHASDELSSKEVSILRELFEGAWADDSEVFTDEDWEHALGGFHFILDD